MRRAVLLVVLLLLLLVGIAALLWLAPTQVTAPDVQPAAAPAVARKGSGPGGEVASGSRAPRDPPKRSAGGAARTAEDPEPEPERAPAVTGLVASDSSLVVIVRQENGQPVQGAFVGVLEGHEQIRDLSRKTLTDAEGRATFKVRGLSAVSAMATWNDQAAQSPFAAPRGGKDASRVIELTLHPAFTFRGRVLNQSGAAVPSAAVRLSIATKAAWLIDLRHDVLTDANGQFAFPALGVSPRMGVEIEAKGFVSFERELAAADLVEPIDFRLERGVVVRGRCVDEQGNPVKGAQVAAVSRAQTVVETATDGQFELEGFGGTDSAVIAIRDGFAAAHLGSIVTEGRDVDVGDLLLRKGGTIRGVLLDAEEKPVANGSVRLTIAAVDFPVVNFETAEDGRFEFTHVGPEPHVIYAEEGDDGKAWSARRHAKVTGVLPDAGEVRVVLTGALGVRLSFFKESDRSPVVVASADLKATRVDANGGGYGYSWAGQVARIDSVRFEVEQSGAYRVEITIPGYSPAVIERVDVLPDREVRIDVLFRGE